MSTESSCFDLPEDCIANALSRTTPKDACRLSAVAVDFRSAAQSDAVWERFLPADYLKIISLSADNSLIRRFNSKKELYLYLCDHPILIDDGLKSFWLEKCSGKKCYMLAARNLCIIWGDTPQYWQWISLPESRFAEVAELVSVCWLEIRGKINISMLSPDTKYAAYLVYSSNSILHGFNSLRVEATVCISGEEGIKNTICLDPPKETPSQGHRVPQPHRGLGWSHAQARSNLPFDTHYPKPRDDGLIEVELGEFVVNGDEDGELVISVMEVKVLNWKRGLIIEGIEIRPKQDVE